MEIDASQGAAFCLTSTSSTGRERLRNIAASLDSVLLLRDIRTVQQKLVLLADAVVVADSTETSPPPLEVFLSSLKVLWHNGEARPTAVHKTPPKRERRRPDPLLHVTDQLKTWFEDEPWRTGRELLEKLQAEQPNIYPDGLLRTIQRRLKGWRTEQARALVFSYSAGLRSAAPVNAEAINTAM